MSLNFNPQIYFNGKLLLFDDRFSSGFVKLSFQLKKYHWWKKKKENKGENDEENKERWYQLDTI